MNTLSHREKLKYLILNSMSERKLATRLKISYERVYDFERGKVSLTRTVLNRIDELFEVATEPLIIDHVARVLKTADVSNYDEVNLEGVKTWNSSHGVNKSHRAHSGHSR